MINYKLLLFDFDGTLFDTWPLIYKAAIATKNNYCGFCNDFYNSYIYSHLERRDLLYMVLGRMPNEIEERFFIDYYKNSISYTNMFPDVLKMINLLNSECCQWGIVTNKPRMYIEKYIGEFTFLKSAVTIICGDDVKTKKPDPDGLILACKLAGVGIKDSILFGDGQSDFLATKKCGMDFGLADYGYVNLTNSERQQCKYIIKTINDLCNKLIY